MSKSLYLVFSKPPEGVTSDEYDRWYHGHVRENIETKGFLSAERYALKPGRPTGVDFRHLAVYEYTGDYQALREDLERRIEDWEDRVARRGSRRSSSAAGSARRSTSGRRRPAEMSPDRRRLANLSRAWSCCSRMSPSRTSGAAPA